MTRKSTHRCKFCGRIGRLTKEHIWPKWLHSSLPKMESNVHFTKFESEEPKIGKMHNRGDPHRQTLKIVCADCNNGWMSRLQISARPYLEPLVRGNITSLGIDGQITLASWAAMFAMVSEWDHPESARITQHHRTYLMKNNVVPPGWHTWLGKYSDIQNNGCTNHFGFEMEKITQESVTSYNMQSTAFTVGNVFFQTLSSDPEAHEISTKEFEAIYSLMKIHPKPLHINAIPNRPYNYKDFEKLSSFLAKSFGHTGIMTLQNIRAKIA